MNKFERMRIQDVRFEIWTEKRYAEVTPSSDPSENYEKQTVNTMHVVPMQDADEFGEWMAHEYGYQDYGNKISFNKIATMTGEQLMIISNQLVGEARKLRKKDKEPIDENACSCGAKAEYVCDCGELLCGQDPCNKCSDGSVNPIKEGEGT